MSILRTVALRAALHPRGQFIRPFSVAKPRFSGENIVTGTDDNFDDLVKSDHTVIVEFWAEWSGSCKLIEAGLKKSAAAHPQVQFVKLNIDQYPDTTQKSNIEAIPTVQAYKNGVVTDYFVGARSDERIEEFVQANDDSAS